VTPKPGPNPALSSDENIEKVDDLVLIVRRKSQNAPINSWDFVWNWYSLFKCAYDNSSRYPAQLLYTTSCSAVIWSQPRRPSHSEI